MTQEQRYPFVPRSNAYLRPGQFWGIPLSDGRFACGIVVALPSGDEFWLTQSRVGFAAGLLDWVGTVQPVEAEVSGVELLAAGNAHIKMVAETGGQILGIRDREPDPETGLLSVTHRMGGTVMLLRNATAIRAATRSEAMSLPIFGTWGFRMPQVIAERYFVRGQPVVR